MKQSDSESTQWKGQSKGTPLGYKIFVWICRNLGLTPAYLLLRFVAGYYFLFSRNAFNVIFDYFRKRQGFTAWKAWKMTYKNNYLLGQTLIDKIVAYAGLNTSFTFNFDGEENLHQMAQSGKGGILLSAHVGNWEMAGHHMKRVNSKLNIVMFDGEHEQIKKVLDSTGEKSFNIITIKDDMSHVYKMGAALGNNELVCLHADRFLEGNKTLTLDFLGAPARFPAGPFQLAAGYNVPVSIVFAFKESDRHYHYFGSSLISRKEDEGKSDYAQRLAQFYVSEVEDKLKQYPEQWFNYYDFWKHEPIHHSIHTAAPTHGHD